VTCGAASHTATYQVICLPRLSAVDPCAPLVCAPSVPHLQWLAWQSAEGSGCIVGGLVAIGRDPAGDGPSVAGDHPPVTPGRLASIRIEWGPCRPTQKVCSPLRLVSYCTVIMPGSYGPDHLEYMLASWMGPQPPGTTTLLNVLERHLCVSHELPSAFASSLPSCCRAWSRLSRKRPPIVAGAPDKRWGIES